MSEINFILLITAFPLVGIVVFMFIIGQSAFNAGNSGMKKKTIVFKALAALAIWFAVSYAMLHITLEILIQSVDYESETPPSFFVQHSEYLLFAGLVIYVLVGIGLGFLIKGRTKWRKSV